MLDHPYISRKKLLSYIILLILYSVEFTKNLLRISENGCMCQLFV